MLLIYNIQTLTYGLSLRTRTPPTVTTRESSCARVPRSKFYTLYIIAPHIHPPPVAPLIKGLIIYTWGVEQPLRVCVSRFARVPLQKSFYDFFASPSRGSTSPHLHQRKKDRHKAVHFVVYAEQES